MAADFPAHPFWDFSVAHYAQPGVAEACIHLQDEYGLDVNLLLFCIWCASDGPGELGHEDIRLFLRRTGIWQAKVVQPLREVRRYCRVPGESPEAGLRQRVGESVLKVEIEAERAEQLMLAGLVAGRPRVDSPETGRAGVAAANLSAYLAALQVEASAGVIDHLLPVLRPAFPDVAADELWRLLSRH